MREGGESRDLSTFFIGVHSSIASPWKISSLGTRAAAGWITDTLLHLICYSHFLSHVWAFYSYHKTPETISNRQSKWLALELSQSFLCGLHFCLSTLPKSKFGRLFESARDAWQGLMVDSQSSKAIISAANEICLCWFCKFLRGGGRADRRAVV